MWQLGGGPNPIFAMTLGNIFTKVGHSELAWTAYQRALMMEDRIPDSIRSEFVEKVRSHQSRLENDMKRSHTDMLASFQNELDRGLEYQRTFQSYEKQQIEAGRSIYDEDFYDEFYSGVGKLPPVSGS